MARKLVILTALALLTLACGPLGRVTELAISTEKPPTAGPPTQTIEEPLPTEPPEEEPTPTPTTAPVEGGLVRQWAVSAVASSEFGDESWAAKQATGAPDTPACGDIGSAWAALGSDGEEWLEVTFAQPVVPTEIRIYQTYTPDQVVKVELIDTVANYHEVYSAEPVDRSAEACPYVLVIPVDVDFPVGALRVTIDQSRVQDWNEIDAVELVGRRAGE